MHAKRNLAHRMGRWSGTHPWTAIAGWVAFVVVSFVIGTAFVTTKTLDQSQTGVGESGRAAAVIHEAFPTSQTRAGEMVLVQTRSGPLAAGDLAAVASDVRERVGGLASVTNMRAPQRSKDGRAALIHFDIRGDSAKAGDKVAPIEAAVAGVARAHAGLRVEEYGEASSAKQFDDKLSHDLQKAEFLSIPITLLILILAFGALLAAGIPVLLGLTSVFSAFGLTAVSSQFMATGDSTQILMMLIGMAVAVDYSLFYLKREREERARGAGKLAALEAAAATSGHAVLVSGVTVMVSLGGMFFMGVPDGGAMAIGSILVVGVAVLGSLTVLPAVLAKLGDRVHRSRLPLLRRLRREERDSRVWGFVLGHVLRRPVAALVAGVGVLAVLALPALGMHTKQTGLDDISRSAFPRPRNLRPHPAVLPGREGRGDRRDPGPRRHDLGRAGRHRRARAPGARDRQGARPDRPRPDQPRPHRRGGRPAARRRRLQRSLAGRARRGARSSLPRPSAACPARRWTSAATRRRPRTATTTSRPMRRSCSAFVLAMAFLLLLVTFRSIVIPIKAIVLNLLVVAAAFGVADDGLPARARRDRSGCRTPRASRRGCRSSCS